MFAASQQYGTSPESDTDFRAGLACANSKARVRAGKTVRRFSRELRKNKKMEGFRDSKKSGD